MNILIVVLLSLAAACTTVQLEPNSYAFGGNRFDAPEHIRGLHARGDSSGAPIRYRAAGQPDRLFYLWALDTELDGVERYDRVAASLLDDVGDVPEGLIPITPAMIHHVPALPAALPDLRIIVPVFDGDLKHVAVCIEALPDTRSPLF
ncbi:MAG TPA: hypothetical protein VN706_02175 [Gemmatimonadaceae bacterium]|nr:hypothetical protein [Gemmatimonadaceae bacterium]